MSRSAAPESVWRIIGSCLAWLLAAILAVSLAMWLAGALLRRLGVPPLIGAALASGSGIAIGQIVWLVAAWRGLRRLPPAAPAPGLGWLPGLALVLLCLVGGAGLVHLTWSFPVSQPAPSSRPDPMPTPVPTPVPGPTAAPSPGTVIREAMAHPGLAALASILSLAVVVVLAPVGEELFFRHWLWRRLGSRSAALRGVATGGLWIASHLRGPLGMLALLPMALLLGWARERSGSPRLGIAMHAAWNCGAVMSASLKLGLG
ncbi:CPBP family intramembrane glutamic endopeptidase [Roseicella sp. DB1501]|uniref:CPBP family intramembrane glutamic endopeptidase n=1 Tax=Roseicella sp. DB1501 TaxID=2730925 RepID=UPI0014910137|nr:CPBP family intramembrane glutamic endopeptidase [Roseicella sp. DB1501]NOG73960.1 CPBP family intramembrane metalloprotease [Roseicella sp. DB1501]